MQVAQIDQISSELIAIKDQKAELEDQIKELSSRHEKLQQQLIEMLTAEGKDKWLIPGKGSLSVSISTYWNISDQDKALAYLKDNAPEQIRLHPTTIRGWANSYAEEHPEWKPEEFGLTSYNKPKINFRRSK